MASTVFFVRAHPLPSSPRRSGHSTPRSPARPPPAACSAANRHDPAPPPHEAHALSRLLAAVQRLERLTRPGAPSSPARFAELPAAVRTPAQMLGRLSPGCEGTAAVFPRCNFACKPCYHSKDANRVRVDGFHTVTEVARQLALLQTERGPTGHCQLIGGEVSLLPPEDHALALEVMRRFGRIPMSFTHGDFDASYLRRLALVTDGGSTDGAGAAADGTARTRPRFDRLDFAVHFDTGMRGRAGIADGGTDETELTPFRARFVGMFDALRAEHGVQSYLAHNMTVTGDNVASLARAVREMLPLGFRLLSFQPAALQGARRVDTLRESADDSGDAVWAQIEAGVGISLPHRLFQMGDPRCNRMSPCAVVGAGARARRKGVEPEKPHVFALFEDECAADAHARDLVMRHVGNIVLPPRVLYAKLARVLLRRPWLLRPFLAWVSRVIARAGGVIAIARRGIQPLTIVMHRFMDADDVTEAWRLMEDGVVADEGDARFRAAGARVRETVERLSACSYAMARPEERRVVPACVQHSVYDAEQNERLAEELPLDEAARAAADADWLLK